MSSVVIKKMEPPGQRIVDTTNSIDKILRCICLNENRFSERYYQDLIDPALRMADHAMAIRFLARMNETFFYAASGSSDFLVNKGFLLAYQQLMKNLKASRTAQDAYDASLRGFHSLLQELSDSCIKQLEHKFSGSIIRYIRINFGRDLSIGTIAQEFSMPTSTLSSKFKKETGMPISAIIIQVRLITAAERLAATKEEESGISQSVGYLDIQSFRKAFRNYFGISPHQYRRLLRTAVWR